MTRTTRIAFSVLTTVAIHSIGFASLALAETLTVTRGPNGAAHQVKADNIPIDAQVQQSAAATSVPRVVTKGPNGAAQVARPQSAPETTAQLSRKSKVITRGPNGAAHIIN